jgi:four helix bundle protein
LRRIPGAERIADQITRSGPSIALNYAEAQAASSRAHFITIIENSEREARETQAALEVIINQEYVKPSLLISLYQESSEIVAILTTIANLALENIALGKRRKT